MFESEKELITSLKTPNAFLAKHLYISAYIGGLLMSLKSQLIAYGISIALIIITMVLQNILVDIITIVFAIIIYPYLFIGLATQFYFFYLTESGLTSEIASLSVVDKIRNLCLINSKVISRKDWKAIKKHDKKSYKVLLSYLSHNKCYVSSFYIANVLKNKDVKIIWLTITFNGKTFGHSVLAKNNYIYDSNFRKTYLQEDYLKHCHSKVFREFSLEEYLTDDIQKNSNPFTHFSNEWQEFKTFCESNDAIRCISEH